MFPVSLPPINQYYFKIETFQIKVKGKMYFLPKEKVNSPFSQVFQFLLQIHALNCGECANLTSRKIQYELRIQAIHLTSCGCGCPIPKGLQD